MANTPATPWLHWTVEIVGTNSAYAYDLRGSGGTPERALEALRAAATGKDGELRELLELLERVASGARMVDGAARG